MQEFLPLLILLCAGVADAGELVVARVIDPANPAYPAYPGSVTFGLRVHAVPGFEVVASNPQITGTTAVSEDGSRLYEMDRSAGRVRSISIVGPTGS